MAEKIIHWTFFGVVFSALPLVLVLGIYKIVGVTIEAIDYVPDLLLVAFAIIVNTLGNGICSDKNLPKALKLFNSVITICSGLLCFGAYFAIFGMSINANNFQIENLSIVTKIAIAMSIGHFILGLAVEITSHICNQRNRPKGSN